MVQKEMAELLIFILVVILSFYLPGRFISEKLQLNLTFLENIFLNAVLGMAFFTLISYFLAWFKLQILMFPLLILLVILNGKKILKFPKVDKKDINYLPIVLLMSLIFSLTMLTSGQFGNNLRFIGVNYSDSFWHLSLINELKFNFPPDNPGFSHIPLKGYHFFFNFLLSTISNLSSLSPPSLYFHFFPLLISFLWGLGVYVLMLKWSNNRKIALWAVFLTLFGGSFSFILRLQGHQGLSMDDAFGMTQPASSLVNPPFSISIVILIGSLFSLLQYFKTRKNNWLIPLCVLAGTITMFKVYAGIILLGSFAILTFWEGIKKNFVFVLAFAASILLFLITYWILRDPSSKLFFFPLWAPHKILEDNLPWYGYSEKYYTYSRLSVIRGLIEIESFALFVFIIGSLGTRIIGILISILFYIKKIKIPSNFALGLIFMSFISLLIPLFFIQSGKVFEIIQMTWYFLFFSSLFASFGIGKFLSLKLNKILKFILFVTLILLTLPSAYEKLNSYITSSGESISKYYLEATNFLKKQGNYDSTVLEVPPPYVGYSKEGMHWWYNTLSSTKLLAFSNKRGYLNNEGITFTGIDADSRVPLIVAILKYEKLSREENYFSYQLEIGQGLKENRIVYIFSPSPLLRLEKTNIIQKIFQNKEASIYKVSL